MEQNKEDLRKKIFKNAWEASNSKIFTPKIWKAIADRITSQPIGAQPYSNVSKEYVFSRDDGACVYCKSIEDLQYDHVIPLAHGGPGVPENVVLACKICNEDKSNSFDVRYLTIAFNHLIYVGEDISWIDMIFGDAKECDGFRCKSCDRKIRKDSVRITDFCSNKYECEFYFESEEDEIRHK